MEPKYVSIDEVVKEYEQRQMSPAEFQRKINEATKYYTNVPIFTERGEVIITEDIDCEIVENKQLPPRKDDHI